MKPIFRAFTQADYEALADVYRDAVETQAPTRYATEQVKMWAAYPSSGPDFIERLERGQVLVAEVAAEVVAFGQLDPVDHVAFLYCKGAFSRRGLAGEIYDQLEAHARKMGVAELTTEASRISRPFFERKGFGVFEVEHVVRLGVDFERFKMLKRLA